MDFQTDAVRTGPLQVRLSTGCLGCERSAAGSDTVEAIEKDTGTTVEVLVCYVSPTEAQLSVEAGIGLGHHWVRVSDTGSV